MAITQCLSLSPEIMKAIVSDTHWKVSRCVNKEWNELLSTYAIIRITPSSNPFKSGLSKSFFSRLRMPIIIGNCIHWSTFRNDWIFQEWFNRLLSCLHPDCNLEIKRLELNAKFEWQIQKDSLEAIVGALTTIRSKSVQIITFRLFARATKLSRVIQMLGRIEGIEMIELYLELSIDGFIDLAIYQALAVSLKCKSLHVRDVATLMPGFADTLAAFVDLQELNLSGIRLENTNAAALASALTMLTHIKTLDLSDCNITAIGATSLSSALSVLTMLHSLDLSGQDVGDAIWPVLSTLLPRAVLLSVASSGRITITSSAAAAAGSTASMLDSRVGDGLRPNFAVRLAASLREAAPPLLTSLNLGEPGRSIGRAEWSAVLGALERCALLKTVNGVSVRTFVTGGLSAFDTVGQDPNLATAFMSYLSRSSSRLTRLDMRETGIGVFGATALSKVLLHLTALQSLDLSHNQLQPAGGTAVASSLQPLTSLTFLDVSYNRLGSDGAMALLKNISLPVLRRIQLNLLGQDLGIAIVLALQVLLPRAASLSVSSNGCITVKSATADTGAAGCVDLSERGQRRAHMSRVAALLRGTSPQTLSSLELSRISAHRVQPLFSALPFLTALQTLNLCYTDLGSSGCAVLAAALTRITSLTVLNLQGNYVGALAGGALGGALGRLGSLRVLLLDANRLDPSAGRAIADALTGRTSLRALSLADNELGDEVTARLRAEWGSLGAWENGPSDGPLGKWPAGAAGLDV